jgi:hypothetical protein
MADTMGPVDSEHGDGCTANIGAADQERAIPTKMAAPLVAARMEEPCALASLRINAREVRAFVMVVGETGEGEIARDGLAAVLFGDDMIDLEREFIIALRHAAVFTASMSTCPNELGKRPFHGRSSAPARTPEYLPGL